MVAAAEAGVLRGTWRGEVEGEILETRRGTNGFGYDPLFYYAPFGRTFGETEPEAKMGVSHRGLALKAMLKKLRVDGR